LKSDTEVVAKLAKYRQLCNAVEATPVAQWTVTCVLSAESTHPFTWVYIAKLVTPCVGL